MKKSYSVFCLALAAALIGGWAAAAHARGASSANAGDGDPPGQPGIYGTSPSPAANPNSPGAGPYSGPTNNTLDPATGRYEDLDAPSFPAAAMPGVNTEPQPLPANDDYPKPAGRH